MSEHVFDQATFDLLQSKIATTMQRLSEVADLVGIPTSDQTLEQFFRNQMDKSIDFRLRVIEVEAGKLQFYIHPLNVSGDTWDFKVEGNTLVTVIPSPCPLEDGPTPSTKS